MQGLYLTHCRSTDKSTDLLTAGNKYVSLVSADKEGSEKFILFVRYMKNSEIREEFFSVLTHENATTDGYMDATEKLLEMCAVLGWLFSCQLLGIGTYGDASMIKQKVDW
jgi:hypothetical protein